VEFLDILGPDKHHQFFLTDYAVWNIEVLDMGKSILRDEVILYEGLN